MIPTDSLTEEKIGAITKLVLNAQNADSYQNRSLVE